jgi:hypothetical protein
MNENSNFRLLYSEILHGYSLFTLNNTPYYIKHLTYLDSADVDIYRNKCLELALRKGLPAYKDRLEKIISDKSWSESQEKKILEIRDYIASLKNTRQKYILTKDKKLVDVEIKSYTDQICDLVVSKEKLIGKTAEQFANRKINEYYLYISSYKDKELKTKKFTEEEFDELDQEILDELYIEYNKKIALFDDGVLKRIALMPIFLNLLILSDNNPFTFFGKSLINLSFNQIELFQHGIHYKNILQNAKTQPPPELMGDPDRLNEWFEGSEGASKMIETNQTQNSVTDPNTVVNATSIVGAKNKDYEKYGIDDKENSALMDKLKTRGELNWQDLI